jgi:hypothetical protein
LAILNPTTTGRRFDSSFLLQRVQPAMTAPDRRLPAHPGPGGAVITAVSAGLGSLS